MVKPSIRCGGGVVKQGVALVVDACCGYNRNSLILRADSCEAKEVGMALYVTSDPHGHVRALDEVLSAVSLGEGDELFVLGDLIDRGPASLEVISLVRSLPNTHILMGNHEQLMLTALELSGAPGPEGFDISRFSPEEYADWSAWMLNGGATTSEQLEQLSRDEYDELCAWMRDLPAYTVAETSSHVFALTHAGINASAAADWRAQHENESLCDTQTLAALLEQQTLDDLLWIREEFWGFPTGLITAQGDGPVVIAGHTPSPYLAMYSGDPDMVCTTEEGQGMIVPLGATPETGNQPDKFDIDCAAAAGYGIGRVGIMRLDDFATWYGVVQEGE